jgi:hypothetical protein
MVSGRQQPFTAEPGNEYSLSPKLFFRDMSFTVNKRKT